MPLAPGARIGGYEIIAMLGAGGMGEVYRARDSRLGRDVAIKILSPAIAADADGLMRFEREARVLASLSHPNIAAIYGVEDGAGFPALILELVDGETLADRIARGHVPVAEALEYAKQIADALDVAHEAGIVHRDLKPGNIKLTDDGRVKVLDFGLAKAIAAMTGDQPDADPSHSPTITVKGTRHGVILGTVAYMSPEQARGKHVDKRTDIWAFGCVLFETLTGKRAFGGETTSDVIAAILERRPELSRLPADVPPHVRRTIERCLEKDPKRRARDIADVRAELDENPGAHATGRKPWWRAAALVTLIAATVGIIGIVAWRRSGPAAAPSPQAPIEFTFGAPPGHTLTRMVPSPSPDGRVIAFSARDAKGIRSLWLRAIDHQVPRQLNGTDGIAGDLIEWSPDSRSLAFFVGNTWKRISADGGPAVTIASDMVANLGLSWGADLLLISPANRTALVLVPAAGGPSQQVTTLDTARENSHRWPHLLPDGRHFLFTARSDSSENLGIKIGSLVARDVRPLVNVHSQAAYAHPGWLLFMTPDEVVMAQRLDPATWTLQGTAHTVAGPVIYNGPSAVGAFDASLDGRVLAYMSASQSASQIVWFDRSGKAGGTVGPPQRYRSIAVSRDGRTIAAELASERYGTRDIWLIDTTTHALTRLTSNPATDWRPVFSDDGSSIVFASDRAGASTVFRIATNGTGGASSLYRDSSGGGAFPQDWSGDGKYVLVNVASSQGRGSQKFVIVPVDGGAPTTLINESGTQVNMPTLSAGGDLLAFVIGTPGARQVYVMSMIDRRRVRVSVDGGWNPTWGPDGRELFFQNPRGEIMRTVMSRSGLAVDVPPAVLFRPCQNLPGFRFDTVAAETNYDVTADGRFVALCDPEDAAPTSVTVVVDWQSKLR